MAPDPFLSDPGPMTLVGGANVSRSVLNICLKHAPAIVAADSGADRVLDMGLTPRAVIGDLDSISPAARRRFAPVLHQITDQDTTDFEKVLQRVAPALILAAGFRGGRLDHTFSALNVLVRYDTPVILVGDVDIVLRAPAGLTLALPPATPVALLPMGAAQVTTRGLKWDLQETLLQPDGLVSSSNESAAGQVEIETRGPVLLTLPLSALPQAIDALGAA